MIPTISTALTVITLLQGLDPLEPAPPVVPSVSVGWAGLLAAVTGMVGAGAALAWWRLGKAPPKKEGTGGIRPAFPPPVPSVDEALAGASHDPAAAAVAAAAALRGAAPAVARGVRPWHTTQEVLRLLGPDGVGAGPLLRLSDSVKYGGHRPSAADVWAAAAEVPRA